MGNLVPPCSAIAIRSTVRRVRRARQRGRTTVGRDAVNPGGHALGRRVSELRVAQQALAAEARALEAGDTFALLAAGNRLHRDHGGTGATCPRPRWPSCGGASALLDDLLGRVEQQTDDRDGDDHHAARLVALLNGPVIVVAPDAPPDGDGDAALFTGRRLVTAGHLARRPARLPAGCTRAGTRGRGRDRRRLARAGPSPRPGDGRGRSTGRRAAGPPGAGGGPRLASTLLPERIVNDPLGAVDELTRVESTLAEVAGARAELARLGEATAAAAADARRTGGTDGRGRVRVRPQPGRDRQPRGAARAGRPRRAEPRARVAPVAGAPGAPRVRGRRAPGRGRAGAAGGRSPTQTVAVARQVAEANARPWRRRRELQGLLRAARVKAGAVGRAEDPWCTELARQATRSLAVPCDLPAAESAIEALLEGLRQPIPSSAADSSAWTQSEPAHESPPQAAGASEPGRRVGAPA